MSTAVPETPPTEQVYGIAKRISLDLEKLPLHTHAAIINIVNTMVQHRKIVLDSEMNAKQLAAQAEAMASAQKAHAEAQVKREAEIARQIEQTPKAPRLRIDLGKSTPAPVMICGCPGPECAGHDEGQLTANEAEAVAVS